MVMSVSIRQLAEHCDVSIGTVDRVLNHRAGVKKETRERVEQAVRELGYTTNYLAKSLSLGKTSSLGVVLFNLNNWFFSQLADAIVKESDASGYFPYLTLSEKSKTKEFECIRNLIARQVDGILLFSTNRDPDFIEFLSAAGLPVVTIMTELTGFPSVRIDDFTAMADAARYIASKQYRRIVYISPPLSYADMNIHVQEQRYKGFLQVAQNESVEPVVIDSSDYLDRASQIDLQSVKTAFLCSSDVYAMDILSSMRLKGLQAPYDYGLMGFDGIQIINHIEPAISTVSVPIEESGRQAVNMIIRAIKDEAVSTLILPHKIIPGQTIV